MLTFKSSPAAALAQGGNHAITCHTQSEKAINPDEKAVWLKIAKEWERMAASANRHPGAF